MDPATKPGPGQPPHETWRNRDYEDEAPLAAPPRRRWVVWVATAMSVAFAGSMLWTNLKGLIG